MATNLPPEIERVLVPEAQLAAAVESLAAGLTRDYADRHPLMIGALTGAVVLLADLVRRLEFPLTVEFVKVRSYGGSAESSGELAWDLEPDAATLAGRHVVIVEDIADTGVTLRELRAQLLAKGAASVAVAVLLDKPERRKVDVQLEYVGLTIPDEFVVGYGLDFDQRFRNLPYVGVLRRAVYETS